MTGPGQDRHPDWPRRRGRRLSQERSAYFALVNVGVGYREAARRVGVDYRLAKRWRAACRPAPPEPEPPTISPRFLSQDERLLIADRLRDKASRGRSHASWAGRCPRSAGRRTATGSRMGLISPTGRM